MKTKNKLNMTAMLAALMLAPVFAGCPDPYQDDNHVIILQEGLMITTGKFIFINEFEPATLEFGFCDNDGDCSTPAENRDEIVLRPNRRYECILDFSGRHLTYDNLKVSFNTTSDLYLTINKQSQDDQLFDGNMTEWITGNQASGEIVLSITDQLNRFYNITLPVKIEQPSDLD